MPNEITLKDVYDAINVNNIAINKRIDGLEINIGKYHDSFIKFEEGKLTQALQDIETAKGQIKALQTQNLKQDDVNVMNAQKRKDWMWGALEKIIFMLIIPLIGLILVKTGIINLNS